MAGYWEPHTSSVDFCEPNYLLSHYIAEPHNVWSSLFITAIAMFGLLYNNPTKEWCVAIMFLVLAAVGIGSAGLHSSLHWVYQSSDEVPMLWQILTFLHMMWIGHMVKKEDRNSIVPSIVFLAIATVQTVLYYRFQQIYAVFIASIVLYVTLIVVWGHFIIEALPEGPTKVLRRRMHRWSLISWVGFATVLWVIDMNMCDHLLPYYVQMSGFTLHVLWHIFAGFSTYMTATNLVVMRMYDLGHEDIYLHWIGFLPVVRAKKIKA